MHAATRRRRIRATASAVALLAVVAAGCSSSSSDGGGTPPATTSNAAVDPAGISQGGAHACDLGASRPKPKVKVLPLTGVPTAERANRTDLDVTSFDGTTIRAHWFTVPGATKAKPAPTILMGPGWSLPGDTAVGGAALFSAATIGGLRAHGYNVVTWDPRGFHDSGGQADVDDPTEEGRDAQTLVDWVATQPETQLDRPGDPRLGMVGLSYGGGIQLTLASIDCRVDALVPGWAWNSLRTSLFKNDTVKTGWSSFLYSSAISTGAHLDPHIVESATRELPTGRLSPDTIAWYLSHGPGKGIDKIDVPTLFVSGTVDTLFTLDEGIANYESLRRRHVPTAMLWVCSGHGTCLTKPGDPTLFGQRTFAWLDHYLKGHTKTDVGPGLDLVDQDGVRWTADHYPTPLAAPVTATGSGTLDLVATGGAGPLTTPPPKGDLLGPLVKGITPSKATNAAEISVDPGQVDGLAIGAPALTVTYTGTATTGTPANDARPERAFAQLIDDDSGLVIGNQITPFAVALDGKRHTTTVPLEAIAQHLRPGHTLTLQIVATTVAYSTPRLGGHITFTKISISLPVAKGLKPTT